MDAMDAKVIELSASPTKPKAATATLVEKQKLFYGYILHDYDPTPTGVRNAFLRPCFSRFSWRFGRSKQI
jgi:hypothetical protein